MAARDRGNAVPVEREQPEVSIPAPAPKPKLVPINKPSETLAPAAAAESSNLMDGPMLGMPSDSQMGGFWSSASGAVKAAIVIGAVAVLGAGGTFVFKGGSPKPAVEDQGTTGDAPGMIVGGGGWTTTWGQDTPLNKGKQISLYRPSMAMSDYRFEFRGQIEKKALGWIFRAKDTKNYYVAKLEVIKPGLSPVVALVKYPVINGKEGTHTQVMLPMEVKADTVYKVRLDVRGNKFTTYVQDKLVDYWTDDQIKQGGTGFYGDKGELAQIKSSTVYYLK
jgi:hypothetical protein